MAFYNYLPSFGLSLSLLAALLVFYYFIYPAFISPLSKLEIPNADPLAKYTPLWILWRRFTQRENKTLYEAHKKLGPVVRVGPNEISVNSLEGLRVIYGGNFDKHAWYPNVFSNYFIDNTFCITKAEPHKERKRMFANVYSKSYLQSSKDIHRNAKSLLFDRLLPIFQSASETSKGVEMLELSAAVGMDWTCAFLFGLSAGSDFIRDAEYRKHWLDTYDEAKSFFAYISEGFVIPLVLANKVGYKWMPNSVLETLDSMGKWNLDMCKKVQNQEISSEISTQTSRPVGFEQMTQGMEKVDSKRLKNPKDMVIASEMLDQILAGHETTAITLTYMMYELCRHPEIQTALRNEVSGLTPKLSFPVGPHYLPDPKSIDRLPLLDAVIQETLRRYPPASGSAPRVTPPGQTTLHGISGIPEGVRVSCSAYTLHRNEDVFPNPEEWKPSRWLDASKEQKAEMNRWFWAFGSGARMCLGIHFAMQGTPHRIFITATC
jgi:Cytochrome P450